MDENINNAGGIGQDKQPKGRPKGKMKNGRTISCYIRSDIYDALVAHCERTGQTKTIAIERAIEKMTEKGGGDNTSGGSEGRDGG